MTTREHFKKALEEMHLVVREEDERNIIFHYQLDTYFIRLSGDDSHAFQVGLQGFYHIDDDKHDECLAICNEINYEMYLVKAYIADESIVISGEQMLPHGEDCKGMLAALLDLMVKAKVRFIRNVMGSY